MCFSYHFFGGGDIKHLDKVNKIGYNTGIKGIKMTQFMATLQLLLLRGNLKS